MQRLGLNAQQLAAYNRGLWHEHERRIIVQILNLEGKLLATLPHPVLDGQVAVDASTQPTSKLEMTLLDPDSTLPFEAEVGELSIHMSRMVRVIDRRIMPGLAALGVERGQVDCKVFTGPLSKPASRDGAVVSISAEDKSVLAMGDAWGERTFPKGTKLSRIMRELLRDTGEKDRFISIPPALGKVGREYTLSRLDKRWMKIRKLARSRAREVFYNGAGVAVARRKPQRVQFTVPVAMVLSTVRISRDATQVFNAFQMLGFKPEGKNKKRVASNVVYLPKSHPDNPARLGRNGVPRRMLKQETNDKIKKKSVANFRARQMMLDALKRSVSLQVDIAPVPHIEPNDMLRVPSPLGGTYQVRAAVFTYPLGGGAMTIGYKRTVSSKPQGTGAGSGGGKGKGGKSFAVVKVSR